MSAYSGKMMEEWCGQCRTKGLSYKLKFFQLNFDEAIKFCQNPDCSYPIGNGLLSSYIVPRKILQTMPLCKRSAAIDTIATKHVTNCAALKETHPKKVPMNANNSHTFMSRPSKSKLVCLNRSSVSNAVPNCNLMNVCDKSGLKNENDDLPFLSESNNDNGYFLQWTNTDALCWLDVNLCLVVHCQGLRKYINTLRKEHVSIMKILCVVYDQAIRVLRTGHGKNLPSMKRMIGIAGGGLMAGGMEINSADVLESVDYLGLKGVTPSIARALKLLFRLSSEFGSDSSSTTFSNITSEVPTVPNSKDIEDDFDFDFDLFLTDPPSKSHNFDSDVLVSNTGACAFKDKLKTPIDSELQSVLEATLKADYPQISYDAFSKSVHIISELRECMFLHLQPRLKCSRGKNDSAMIAMMMLLHENGEIRQNFNIKFSWEMTCNVCGEMKIDKDEKPLIGFPNAPENFNMNEPYFLRACYYCNAPEQRRHLLINKLSSCVVLHFMEGISSSDMNLFDFVHTGDHYRVTGVVQYKRNPDHFVAWVKNVSSNLWMVCDGLHFPLCKYDKQTPVLKKSEVHLVMWERMDKIPTANVVKHSSSGHITTTHCAKSLMEPLSVIDSPPDSGERRLLSSNSTTPSFQECDDLLDFFNTDTTPINDVVSISSSNIANGTVKHSRCSSVTSQLSMGTTLTSTPPLSPSLSLKSSSSASSTKFKRKIQSITKNESTYVSLSRFPVNSDPLASLPTELCSRPGSPASLSVSVKAKSRKRLLSLNQNVQSKTKSYLELVKPLLNLNESKTVVRGSNDTKERKSFSGYVPGSQTLAATRLGEMRRKEHECDFKKVLNSSGLDDGNGQSSKRPRVNFSVDKKKARSTIVVKNELQKKKAALLLSQGMDPEKVQAFYDSCNGKLNLNIDILSCVNKVKRVSTMGAPYTNHANIVISSDSGQVGHDSEKRCSEQSVSTNDLKCKHDKKVSNRLIELKDKYSKKRLDSAFNIKLKYPSTVGLETSSLHQHGADSDFAATKVHTLQTVTAAVNTLLSGVGRKVTSKMKIVKPTNYSVTDMTTITVPSPKLVPSQKIEPTSVDTATRLSDGCSTNLNSTTIDQALLKLPMENKCDNHNFVDTEEERCDRSLGMCDKSSGSSRSTNTAVDSILETILKEHV